MHLQDEFFTPLIYPAKAMHAWLIFINNEDFYPASALIIVAVIQTSSIDRNCLELKLSNYLIKYSHEMNKSYTVEVP